MESKNEKYKVAKAPGKKAILTRKNPSYNFSGVCDCCVVATPIPFRIRHSCWRIARFRNIVAFEQQELNWYGCCEYNNCSCER